MLTVKDGLGNILWQSQNQSDIQMTEISVTPGSTIELITTEGTGQKANLLNLSQVEIWETSK